MKALTSLVVSSAVVAMFFIATIAVVPALILQGYVISWLWRWFVVPTFHTEVLPISIAIGLALFLRFTLFPSGHQNKSLEGPNPFRNWIIIQYISPFFVLLGGYIIHCFS